MKNLKFVEFTFTETDKDMKLYAKLSDGSLVYVRDYDYSYEGEDIQFYRDEQGLFNELYCYGGVSYRIHNGKLLESTQDMYGVGDEWEITLSMLTKDRDLIPALSHEKAINRPKSPFAL